jgi:hypothetical protein
MLSPLAIVSARSELLGLAKANCWISPQQKSCKFASAAVGKEGQKLKNVPGAMPRQAGGSQWIAESANHEANAAIKTRWVGAFPSQLWEFLAVGGRFR